ncbi:MAG: S8 family serine peptidase [Actinomycetota bacterium]
MPVKPAWSEQFDHDALKPAPLFALDTPITREWAWGDATGAGVKVAVIDSGIDANHEAVGHVEGGVVLEYDEDTEEVHRIEGPHEDLFGHGTACAGIIRTVAPEAELYSVRVLGERLTGKGVVFAEGLRWALENGIQVANMSLSTSKRDFFDMFHELADEAYFHNVMLVSAINNVKARSYPSEYSSVFSVAAHARKDPFGFDYNPSPPVEFGAPGISVRVAWTDGRYMPMTGNSFAAPHIAGLITRILSKHPGLTPFQMKTILAATADNATTR